MKEWTVPAALTGKRLDLVLRELDPALSRARVKAAIERGGVRVNGKRTRKGESVKSGDKLSLDEGEVSSKESPAAPEPDAPLDVRFESPSVVVVEKPSGQPTAPLRVGETGTLANALVGRFPEMAGVGYSAREPGLVHRLDNATSGLVVAGRTKHAFDVLVRALRDGQLQKKYLLVCKSEGLPDDGMIEFPIANHPKDARRVYPCVHPRDVMRYAPRPALTRFTVKERWGADALVEATVSKALRHQIRAHFASIGHPLIGDVLYGGEVREGFNRHALHASFVEFPGEEAVDGFSVSSPLPDDIRAACARE